METNPSLIDPVINNPPKHEGPVKRLLRLTENAPLLRSTDGRCYAQVFVGRRRETLAIRSSAFQDYLIDGYYRAHQELPSDWSMRRALRALEATARFEGARRRSSSGSARTPVATAAHPSITSTWPIRPGAPSSSAPAAGRSSITPRSTFGAPTATCRCHFPSAAARSTCSGLLSISPTAISGS
jgi:hypothetical protein